MSATATDRDLEMLAWLAEWDMEAVAHAHRQFLAASEPEAVASLGRTYQRVPRCLRTTLALKMKGAQAQASQAAWTKVGARRDENLRDAAIEARTLDLQDALERVANAAIPDPREREDRLADFDLELDDWIEADDFLTADLDEQVLRACRLMESPEDLAPAWRTLPRPAVFPEDLPQDDAVAADPVAGHRTARPADTSSSQDSLRRRRGTCRAGSGRQARSFLSCS